MDPTRMKVFPLLDDHLKKAITIIENNAFFFAKRNATRHERNLEDYKRLFMRPRRLLFSVGERVDALFGFGLLDCMSMPHRFGNLELYLSDESTDGYQEAIFATSVFAFGDMNLRSVQLSVIEGEISKRCALEKIGWSLDVTLRQERIIFGHFADEYRFGMLQSKYRMHTD